MRDKWNKVYENVTETRTYGDSTTYMLGAAFLRGLSVEDWGCGFASFRAHHDGPYKGIDGSCSKFASAYVELGEYISKTDGLFMRHILEHNHGWKQILKNAVASFQKRMVLVIFTPFVEQTAVLQEVNYGAGLIPDISFAKGDLLDLIQPFLVREETLKTATQYSTETVFYLEKI